MWIYVYSTCILYTVAPWWTEHVCIAHKKDYFSSLLCLLYTARALFSSSSFSQVTATHRFFFYSRCNVFVRMMVPLLIFCLFVTCCQLFNISKHMMSNKIFPLPYKYTFDHHFYTNSHAHMNAIRSILFMYTHHVENNEMVHLLFMWFFIPYRTHLLLSSCLQKKQAETDHQHKNETIHIN